MNASPGSAVQVESGMRRLAAAVIFLLCFAWLVLGTQLSPDPHGVGTHQQLGLASQCSFEAEYGFACPTCGMTTAFSLATQGRVLEAAVVQPAGALLALVVAIAACLAAAVAITGCRLTWLSEPLLSRWRTLVVVSVCVLIVGWLTRLAAG